MRDCSGFLQIRSHLFTVDPHLSRILVSGRTNYPDSVMTVQLEFLAESVRFIRVFECSSVYKWKGFNYPNFSFSVN